MMSLKHTLFSLFLILISCGYDCQKDGWDGTYEDCYDNFDLQYFPFYGEHEAWQIIPGGKEDGSATIEFDPSGSFALLLSIHCEDISGLDVCNNIDPDSSYWVLEIEGSYTYSNTLKAYIGTGKSCPYRYREHHGQLDLKVQNSNQEEFENKIISSYFHVRCPEESLVINYVFTNGDFLQVLFGDM